MRFWGQVAWFLLAISLAGITARAGDWSRAPIQKQEVAPDDTGSIAEDNWHYLLRIRRHVEDGSVVLIRDQASGIVVPVKSDTYQAMRHARILLTSRTPREARRRFDRLPTEVAELQQRDLAWIDKAIRKLRENRRGPP